jgi:hypothetical protein
VPSRHVEEEEEKREREKERERDERDKMSLDALNAFRQANGSIPSQTKINA